MRVLYDGGMETATRAPDFDQLARETPWPQDQWRDAWHALSKPEAWPHVVALAFMQGPVGAAHSVERALAIS